MNPDLAAWCEAQNRIRDLEETQAIAGFFSEPFDLSDIAMMMFDDKFYIAAYAVAGSSDRWHACAAQLPALFLEFMDAGISDHNLYKLTALMFRWAGRFEGAPAARRQLWEHLNFIDHDRVAKLVRRLQTQESDGARVWCSPPWRIPYVGAVP